jgi:hypothetical protein
MALILQYQLRWSSLDARGPAWALENARVTNPAGAGYPVKEGMGMAIEKIVQYECKVCGRRLDVTRTGDVYEEPILCCGVEAMSVGAPAETPVMPAVKKPAKKKAKKKAAKKPAKKAAKKAKKKPAKKKAVKRPAKKKAAKKKTAKKKTAKKKKR